MKVPAVLDHSADGLYFLHMANAKKKRKAQMLGLGLDSDGHKRITKGDNFTLGGGARSSRFSQSHGHTQTERR